MHSFLQLLLTPSRGMNLWRAAHLEDQATPHKVEYRRGAAVIALAPHSEGEGGALIVHVMQLAGCTGRFALQPCSRPSTGSAVCLCQLKSGWQGTPGLQQARRSAVRQALAFWGYQ